MYNKLNDYELLYMVGECNDFDILYQKYQPLILKMALKYQNVFKTFGYEIEDLMQIGYITLYRASKLYNSNDSLFYTYFINSLNKSIVNEMRLNITNKRKILNEAFSYDNIIPDTDISYLDIIPCEDKDHNEEEKEFVFFKNTLSFINACIFEMFYNGFSKDEIVNCLDIDDHILKRSLKEIRRHKKVQEYE